MSTESQKPEKNTKISEKINTLINKKKEKNEIEGLEESHFNENQKTFLVNNYIGPFFNKLNIISIIIGILISIYIGYSFQKNILKTIHAKMEYFSNTQLLKDIIYLSPIICVTIFVIVGFIYILLNKKFVIDNLLKRSKQMLNGFIFIVTLFFVFFVFIFLLGIYFNEYKVFDDFNIFLYFIFVILSLFIFSAINDYVEKINKNLFLKYTLTIGYLFVLVGFIIYLGFYFVFNKAETDPNMLICVKDDCQKVYYKNDKYVFTKDNTFDNKKDNFELKICKTIGKII